MSSDLVRLACERAVVNFGNYGDGMFNAAGFSFHLKRLAGMKDGLDGMWVNAILSGRKDVVPCGDGDHYKLKSRWLHRSGTVLLWILASVGVVSILAVSVFFLSAIDVK